MKVYTALRYIGIAASLFYLVGLSLELSKHLRNPSFELYGWESLLWMPCCVIMAAILLCPWKKVAASKPVWRTMRIGFYIAASVAIVPLVPRIFDIYNGQLLLIALVASQVYVVGSFQQQGRNESEHAGYGDAEPAA